MSWTYLIAATFFDVIATVSMKQSEGFSKALPSLAALSAFGLSIFLLALALQKLGIVTVYVVWVGLGIVSVTLLGLLIYQEAISTFKLISVALIMAGIIGMSLSSNLID